MTITYETNRDTTGTRFRCTVEERVRDFLGSTLKRGVSSWHPAKGAAKREAIASMQAVLF